MHCAGIKGEIPANTLTAKISFGEIKISTNFELQSTFNIEKQIPNTSTNQSL
jgi:hypothetical protein